MKRPPDRSRWTEQGFWGLRLLLLAAFGASSFAGATTYYVDATGGSDSNNGTATTRAWKTLSKVTYFAFSPGDAILFKRGETWRGQLQVVRSGTATNLITYGAYGTGDNPVLNGADVVTGWTAAGNNTYTTPMTTEPDVVVFNGTKGVRQAALGNVNAAYEWFWASNVLTIYSASSPSNMEVSTRHFTLAISNVNYVKVQGFTIKYGVDSCCFYQATHATVDGLTVYDGAGMAGILLISEMAGLGEYNTVQNCVVYNITGSAESLQSDTDGCGVYLYSPHCNHNTVSGCTTHHLGHEGIVILGGSNNLVAHSTAYQCGESGFRVATETSAGNTIEYNTSYENGQKVDDRFGIDLIRVGDNNIVRYNIVHDQHDTLNDPNIPGNDGNPKYGTGGIRFDGGNWLDHDYMASVGNKAYYNLVYNECTGAESYNFSNIEFYNNVLYNTTGMGLGFVSASSTISSNNVARNNVVSTTRGTHFCRYRATSNHIDYNVYYGAPNPTFQWDSTVLNFTNWKSASQQDAHSQAANPLFVNAGGHDFHLQAGSPCIDHGVDVGLSPDLDGTGVPQRAAVDVGAYEVPTPTVTVVSPNGGEMWTTGETRSIQWTYTGDPGANVKVELLAGGVPTVLAASTPVGGSGAGSYSWTIPLSQMPGTTYRVRVTSVADATCTDTSDADFVITAPAIAVVSPNGGETWAGGETHTIRWTYTGDPGANVKIELLAGGTPTALAASVSTGTGGAGSWDWTIPTTQGSGSNYRIRVTSLTNAYCLDSSNANFTISTPSITVASPNGGETWFGGETHTIQWTYGGNPGPNVQIELLQGGSPTVLVASASIGSGGTGSWNWTIPPGQTPAANCRIRVTSTTTASCTDTSNGDFTITVPSITVSAPNGGQVWMTGETHTIQWSYNGRPGAAVQIELLDDGTPTVLAASVPLGTGGVGSWNWQIPLSQSVGARFTVRLTCTTLPACSDASNGTFTINSAPVDSVDLIAPDGGETWVTGETYSVQWNYSGNPGANVQIELLDNGTPSILAASVPLGSGGSGSWSWTIPLFQAEGFRYRVRVTSVGNPAHTDTSHADFNITSPTLSVAAPNGGETWVGGETRTIRWTYVGDPGSFVRIELLKGAVPTTLADNVPVGVAGTGSWDWTIPASQNPGIDYQVRVTSTSNPYCVDQSAANFTIYAPSIGVLVPNGGDPWYGGDLRTIRWVYTGYPGANVRIELLDAGAPVTLAASVPIGGAGSGTWDWTIPTSQPYGTNYRIRVTCLAMPVCTDTSNGDFTITPPMISLASPIGGETWIGGETRAVRWNYTGAPGALVNLELLNNGVPAALATGVSIGTGGAGSWSWTIPVDQLASTEYQVRVTSVSMPACTGISPGLFAVTAPALTVVTPNGGEDYPTGVSMPIQWAYAGEPGGTVRIDLLTGGMPTPLVSGIAIGTGGAGTWNWTVPLSQPGASNYGIRVSSEVLPGCTDDSDGEFTITPPQIAIDSPNGGESWMVGQTYPIQWHYTGDPGATVSIELLDGGLPLAVLASNVAVGSGGAGSWSWAIPASQTVGTTYRIRIASTTNPYASAEGAAPFSLVPQVPALTVTSPNGTEHWLAGSTAHLTWTYADSPGPDVRIELLNNGVPSLLAASVPLGVDGSGSWDWAIPAAQPVGTQYRMRVTSNATPGCADDSDGDFAIMSVNQDTITVTYPNIEESWLAWNPLTVTWTYTGDPGPTVKIELLQGGGSSTVLAASVPIGSGGNGAWTWNIPLFQASRSDYQIRITSTTSPACTDTSDGFFTLMRWAGVRIEFPNGGEQWGVGETHTLRWSYAGDPGSAVTITLLRGSVSTTLASNVSIGSSGHGSWTWDIPLSQMPASNYRVKVATNGFFTNSDTSDASFTISKIPPAVGPIVVEPASPKSLTGSALRLSVQVLAGTPPMTYQWLKDGAPIPGATDAAYTIESARPEDSGDYTCTVSNDAGSDTPDPVTLAIADPLVMLQGPQDADRMVGETHTFSVAVAGGFLPLTYEWFRDGVCVATGTDSCYCLPAVDFPDAGLYAVTISDSDASAIQSDPARLTVWRGLPALSGSALTLLAAALAFAGRRVLRRR